MTDLRTDTPVLTHYLGVVVRFVDPFTNRPVPVQFSVSIPALRWSALWWGSDSTYRFSKSNVPVIGGVPQLPAGTFDLKVVLPGRENDPPDPPTALPRGPYAAFEPRQVTLPPAAPHPPPVLVSDYLVELTLWPTVAFTVPAGETAVVGQIVSSSAQSVVGLKVLVFQGATPPAGTPYTRTDAAGQFLYRLPDLKRKVGALTASLGIQVFSVANAQLAVTPSTFPSPVPIGQVTRNLTFNVP
jgi:hypothetical protein